MSETVQLTLLSFAFRLGCVLAGCFLAWLGYRLFQNGIYAKAGELEAKYSGMSLTLRQVGPGVFFALFGVAMAAVSFLRPFSVASTQAGTNVIDALHIAVPPALALAAQQKAAEEQKRPAPAPGQH